MSSSAPDPSAAQSSSTLTLDGLAAALRLIMMAMLSGVVLIAIIVTFTMTDGAGPMIPAVATVAAAVVLLVVATVVPGRLLKPWAAGAAQDPARASAQLRGTAFVAMALAELPVMAGVVGSVVWGGWLPVAAGGVLSAVGIALLGPTRANLGGWNERLQSLGARTGL